MSTPSQDISECTKYKPLVSVGHSVSILGGGETAFGGGMAIYAQWTPQHLSSKRI